VALNPCLSPFNKGRPYVSPFCKGGLRGILKGGEEKEAGIPAGYSSLGKSFSLYEREIERDFLRGERGRGMSYQNDIGRYFIESVCFACRRLR